MLIAALVFWSLIAIVSLLAIAILSFLQRKRGKTKIKTILKVIFTLIFFTGLTTILVTLIQISMRPNLNIEFEARWLAWLILALEAVLAEIYIFNCWWKNKKSIPRIVGFLLVGAFLTFCLLLVLPPIQIELFPLEDKIQYKITELSELRERLSQKQEEVTQLIYDYHNGIVKIKNEILDETQQKSITTYEQASRDSRVNYDLILIQRKQAYIQKLTEIEQRLKIGTYELEYLEREADDDLKMAKILRNKETENLVEEINRVIKKYMPDASNLVINIDDKGLQSPEEIWREIVRQR